MIRAAAIAAPHAPVEIVELAAPALEPGAALLRTVYSEVCGTDVHLQHGRLSGVPYPLVPGHVSVGRIEAMRGPITDVEGRAFREGDLVTFLDVHETCGACYQCLVAKQTTRCPARKVYGITYGAEDGPLGGWAEQIWMKPGVKMIRLPGGSGARDVHRRRLRAGDGAACDRPRRDPPRSIRRRARRRARRPVDCGAGAVVGGGRGHRHRRAGRSAGVRAEDGGDADHRPRRPQSRRRRFASYGGSTEVRERKARGAMASDGLSASTKCAG